MAAGPTFEPLATTTLSSAASSITFSSIPSTYTDLRVVMVPTVASGTGLVFLRFNSDATSTYSVTELYGNGTGAFSSSTTNSTNGINLTGSGLGVTTTPHLYTADIFSYAGSTYKSVLNTISEDQNGSGYVISQVGMWRSTAAITTVALVSTGTSYAAGTTATLYGILKA